MKIGLLNAWLDYMDDNKPDARQQWLNVLERKELPQSTAYRAVDYNKAVGDFINWMSNHKIDLLIYQRYWREKNGTSKQF